MTLGGRDWPRRRSGSKCQRWMTASSSIPSSDPAVASRGRPGWNARRGYHAPLPGSAITPARGSRPHSPTAGPSRRGLSKPAAARPPGTRHPVLDRPRTHSSLICAPNCLAREPHVTSSYSAFGVSASARGVTVAVTPGNDGGPARPRADVPRQRMPRHKTGALSRRKRRARRRAHRPGLFCAQARHHAPATTRGAASGTTSALIFQTPTALPAQPGETTTANGATSTS